EHCRVQAVEERTNNECSCEISLLRQAVLQNNDQLLSEMLCQEIYKKVINCRGGWGVAGTPLHAAVSKGHLSCLQVLLAHGAKVDCVDVKAQTPLFAAVRGKYLECVLALLRAGANPNGNSTNNCSPVLTAAREGDVEILKELLRHGAEVNSRSKVLLWTSSARVSSGPLYLAAVYGHLECFKLLLLYGADPDYNCTDARLLSSMKQPKTVLEMCLRHGCDVEFIQLLIDFGANVYLPTLFLTLIFCVFLTSSGNPKTLMSQCRLALMGIFTRCEDLSLSKAPPVCGHVLFLF
uniref:Ankyrin repeat and SOCS box containing 12 n=1 Tax=Cynoglossus semilaevis TaxID=244447 RepID=A0A3P8WW32_CYNSE